MIISKIKLIIAIAVAALALALSYSGYWFYKSKKIKEQVNKSITLDSASATPLAKNIKAAAGKIEVSGFPLKHIVIIDNLRFSDPDAGSITFEKLAVESGAFSSDLAIKILAPIILSDNTGKVEGAIELNSDHKIALTIAEDKIKTFKYNGDGFKILDEHKNLAYVAEIKNWEILFLNGEMWQYKSNSSGTKISDAKNNVIYNDASSLIDLSALLENKKTTQKISVNIKDYASSIEGIKGDAESKNNFTLAAELTLVPNESITTTPIIPEEQIAKMPPESRDQFYIKSAPYSWTLNLQNLDFSNPSYKFLASGGASTFADEEIPSGNIIIKIENLDKMVEVFLGELKTYPNKILSQGQEAPANIDDNQSGVAADKELQQKIVVSVAEGISEFVTKSNLWIKDLATKNPLSKDNLVVLEIKREKKSDSFINDVPLGEIMSKISGHNNPSAGILPNHAEPQIEVQLDPTIASPALPVK